MNELKRVARQVTDEVMGAGTYDEINHIGAGSLAVIEDFSGRYGFLSNFHPSEVTLTPGLRYDLGEEILCPTVEHAFQASKATTALDIEEIAVASSPGQAKALGRHAGLRPDWEEVKVEIMQELVRQKFEDTHLAEQLLATAPALLVEGNTWHDRFWGVCTGQGLNWLGILLMATRNQLEV